MFLKQSSVVYLSPPESEGSNDIERRFTLSQLNMLGDGQYLWCRYQVELWVKTETGLDAKQYLRVNEKADDNERQAVNLFLAGLAWAHIYSSLRKIERREIDADGKPLGEWIAEDTPEVFKLPQTFIDGVSPDLISALEKEALALNPTFNLAVPADDAKKKYGVRLSSGQSKPSNPSSSPSRKTQD